MNYDFDNYRKLIEDGYRHHFDRMLEAAKLGKLYEVAGVEGLVTSDSSGTAVLSPPQRFVGPDGIGITL